MNEREVDEISRFLTSVGRTDLWEYLAVQPGGPAQLAAEAIARRRDWAQGQQSNPKFRQEALWVIKHRTLLLRALVEEAESYRAATALRDRDRKLQILRLFILGSLSDGVLTARNEEAIRAQAAELGIDEADTADTIAGMVADRAARREGVPGEQEPFFDHYATLGVTADADLLALQAAWQERYQWARRLRDQRRATAIYDQLDAAWKLLRDPASRAEYDRKRRTWMMGRGPTVEPEPLRQEGRPGSAAPETITRTPSWSVVPTLRATAGAPLVDLPPRATAGPPPAELPRATAGPPPAELPRATAGPPPEDASTAAASAAPVVDVRAPANAPPTAEILPGRSSVPSPPAVARTRPSAKFPAPPMPVRGPWFAVAALVGLVALALAVWRSWPAPPAPPMASARLVITASPPTGNVYVDDVLKGTQGAIDMNAGVPEGRPFVVRVEADGFAPWQETLTAAPGAEVRREPVLTLTDPMLFTPTPDMEPGSVDVARIEAALKERGRRFDACFHDNLPANVSGKVSEGVLVTLLPMGRAASVEFVTGRAPLPVKDCLRRELRAVHFPLVVGAYGLFEHTFTYDPRQRQDP